jgi:hypothetical protein
LKNKLFINEKIWNEFSDIEMDNYVQEVFDFYKKNGFPYFDLDKSQQQKVFDKMVLFDTNTLILEDNKLKQVMHGLNLVNYYMPHMWHTKSHSFRAPIECFNNDELLMKAIRKRTKMGSNMSDAGMRKSLSWTHGTHRVSNFRPTIAKYIYDNYSGDGNVLDFSSGYGGRLLGAMTSKRVKKYTGVDPCKETYTQLLELAKMGNKYVELHNEPFEDVKLNEKYDLSFSSPPYFNTEEYDYDKTQSFIRYDTKDKWRDNFLKVIIEKNYNLIKDNGYFIINAASVKTYPELADDVLKISKDVGFKLIKEYKMALSSLMKSGFKYEPIFVFKKK